MIKIKMHISKVKLPFYPPCEVKCRLQMGCQQSPRIEFEKADHPKSEHSLGGLEQATWTKRQNIEEGGRNVQAKKKGNIQVKYPLPPYSIHCTNSADCINVKMIPKQYPHSLQHILRPPAKS